MDRDKLDRILKRIGKLAMYPGDTTPTAEMPTDLVLPLLTLEEFFDGDDDQGSLGANLDPAVTPAQMNEWLLRIRDRSDVQDVRILVIVWGGPDQWPHSDTVVVVTTAPPEVVESWIPDGSKPDEIWAGMPAHSPIESLDVPAGMGVVTFWYD